MDSRFAGIIERQRLNSIKKEIFRKSIHICSAFVPTFLGIADTPVVVLLILAVCLYSVCEILRLKGVQIPFISKITETAARKRDENKFVLGPVTLVIGILIAAILLPLEYARVGIYALAFGDGFASLIGKLFGRVSIPGAKGKTAAGSLACFFAVFISTFCCSGNCLVSLLVGCAAMLIEVLPIADLDNIIIPISISWIYYQFSTFILI